MQTSLHPPATPSSSDLLAALESHADVVSWINDVLVPEGGDEGEGALELTDLDRRVSSLVGALEIASEDTSAEVERLIEDVSRGASRLTYDLHYMRDGALSLRSVLHVVESKSAVSAGTDTDAALEQLNFLDTVKRNMEAAREVLREAESWGTLESDVISLLGEKNYEKAAERLSEANNSMSVFENTPEYESRRTLMVNLQNQLEAALSSALVAAVSSQDVTVCRNYFGIFSNIQREAEFRNYYYGSRRASLVDAWKTVRLHEDTTDADSSTQAFSSFLPTFYTSFLSILQTERSSIPAIFPDPQQTLSTLITSTLSGLQPTFSQRLASVSTHYGATALREVITTYRATEEFALAVEKIFEKVGYTALLTPAAGGEGDGQRGHLRRKSSRMSMSMSRRTSSRRASISGNMLGQNASIAALLILEWDTELFAPFADLQAEYTALERRLLDDTLAAAIRTAPMTHEGSDRARTLRERAVDVYGAAEEAIARCMAFTHGYGAAGLVDAVNHLLAEFADTCRGDISRKTVGSASQPGVKSSVSEEELADLDYTADDWAEIQALLHVLEVVRALLDRTATFEGRLRASLVQISTAFRAARQDSSDAPARGTTKGAVQTVMQTTLNSAALHALLENVDPELPQPQLPPSVPPSPEARRGSFMSTTPLSPLATPPTPPLLTNARDAIASLAQACQISLQSTILSPLYAHLGSYASLSFWTAPDPASKRQPASGTSGTGATSAVRVPTFSLSPSPTMARVAEGLLSLPRLFEVYADDDALAVSLATLPHIGQRALRALAEPLPPSTPTAGPPEMKVRRSASLALIPGQQQLLASIPTAPNIGDLHFSAEAVTAAWLASLARTLLANLTREVLPRIPKLTAAGAAQLAADLGWLSNIVEALNVEWTPLGRWRKWVEEEDAEGRTKVLAPTYDKEEDQEDGRGEGEEDDEDANDSEEHIRSVVARLRGWT